MAIDPGTVTLMGTYRIGFAPPVHGSLTAGELYLEVAPEGGVPRLWVGTISDGTYPGDAVSLIPAGVTLDPLPTEPPVNVDVPYVAQEGATLTCTMGNWDGVPTQYDYQWQRDGVANGATGASYTLTPDDAGHSFSCVVTASNAMGSTEAPPSNEVVAA